MPAWRPEDSRDLYYVSAWGDGLFDVNDAGHAVVRAGNGTIDLQQLAQDCVRRGLRMPLLVRLPDVIEARVAALTGTFAEVISEQGYQGRHRGVYPIKVNQQRRVVEAVLNIHRETHFGLEVGSKPELLVALALLDDPQAPIIVNGYKDAELVELALAARQIGRDSIVVVEQASELDTVLERAAALDLDPVIGVRIKLAAAGAGRWAESSGDRAKFGLDLGQLLHLVERLRAADSLDALQLLHFHIGSQVSAIRAFRDAALEAARVYVELVRLGAPLRMFDVGGGLGVDYDGSRTDFASSMNYDLREYVTTIVETVREVCDQSGVAHPDIVTETGRWLVAPGTVLITSVLDTHSPAPAAPQANRAAAENFPSVRRMWAIYDELPVKSPQRALHTAVQARDEVHARFVVGNAPLEERAACDQAYSAVCGRLMRTTMRSGSLHEELEELPRQLADTYLCNFSVFQSVPDSWAVEQLFPIMPIGRLDEQPTRSCVLADLTCDSDGKIDRFIDARDVKRTLDVHPVDDKPYYIGIFLLGAYQETLGDLHNLFGDTHAVHVRSIAEAPGYKIEHVIEGDSVEAVLGYVQYGRRMLVDALRRGIEDAYTAGTMSFEAGTRLMALYTHRLSAYTYLQDTF